MKQLLVLALMIGLLTACTSVTFVQDECKSLYSEMLDKSKSQSRFSSEITDVTRGQAIVVRTGLMPPYPARENREKIPGYVIVDMEVSTTETNVQAKTFKIHASKGGEGFEVTTMAAAATWKWTTPESWKNRPTRWVRQGVFYCPVQTALK
jgi:hypothetical protein